APIRPVTGPFIATCSTTWKPACFAPCWSRERAGFVSAAHTGRLGAAILLTAGGLLALPRAHSQGLGATASHATAPFGPAMEDDRPYAHVLFNELEWRAGPTDRFRWDGEGWIGTDTQRLW